MRFVLLFLHYGGGIQSLNPTNFQNFSFVSFYIATSLSLSYLLYYPPSSFSTKKKLLSATTSLSEKMGSSEICIFHHRNRHLLISLLSLLLISSLTQVRFMAEGKNNLLFTQKSLLFFLIELDSAHFLTSVLQAERFPN